MKSKKDFSVAVIVQCRLSSSRLPGKALLNLGGKTVFEWTLDSMKKLNADHYIVATDEDSFSSLEKPCKKHGWQILKGPLQDVLERYCMAINSCSCDIVVRATADNPFLFYEAAQSLIDEFIRQNDIAKCDYMTWTGLPHGSGVEIFWSESLLKASSLTNDPYDHEHVGPAIYNHKDKFVSLFHKAPERFYFPHYRTTIDTSADYRRALAIIQKRSGGKAPKEPYTTEEIISAVTDPFVHDTVLFVPSTKKGQGTGHLRRCLSAAKEIGAFVYVPENAELLEAQQIVQEAISDGLNDFQIIRRMPEVNEFALVACDMFITEEKTATELRKTASLVLVDEGGDVSYADYVLDVIPSTEVSHLKNANLPSLIARPKNKRQSFPKEFKNILVCFGGEDPANLSVLALCFIKKNLPKSFVTVISSKKTQDFSEFDGVSVLDSMPNLKEYLYEYDLVVSHYGLTAFEASCAGCAVLLCATSPLHEKLALSYGFKTISNEALLKNDVQDFFALPESFIPKHFVSLLETQDAATEKSTFGSFIQNLSHGSRYECPICGKKEDIDKVVFRTVERTFRRCSECGMMYISWSSACKTEYKESYFAEQYKAQYGKTYLEDFENIKKIGISRSLRIKNMLHGEKRSAPKLLDIGCAYGPFLSAAVKNGFQPYGTDVAQDAVRYVQKTLLFPAIEAAFPEFDPVSAFGTAEFDAVTMWFVIEHFSDLTPVLEKVSSLVKKGGVFAFSTPSAEGVSARRNTQKFFEQSPSDHFTLWEPSKCSKILKKFGFKVEKIVSTGHHPERFPNVQKYNAKNGSALFSFYNVFSKIFKYGDTFEVYCKKI